MSDLFTTELYRPVAAAAWKRYVDQAAALAGDKGVGGEDSEERAAELRGQVLESLKVTLACDTLTRLDAMKRSRMRDQVIEYASEITGLPKEEIDLQKADFDHAADIVTRLQATDILSCLSWDDCAGLEFGAEAPEWFGPTDKMWKATKEVADWVQAPDWFFTACLDLAWQANPQLALNAGQVPFG